MTKKKPAGARSVALLTLNDISSGKYPEKSLEEYQSLIDPLKSSQERALAMQLVFGVLRWQTRLDWILARYLKKPQSSLFPALSNILRLGLFQIIYLDRVPISAAVNESVNLAKAFSPRHGPALVNGVLRAIARTEKLPSPESADLPEAEKLAIIYSHAEWMVKRWISRLGLAETKELLKANNQIPPLTLRVNDQQISREDLASKLKDETDDIYYTAYASHGLKLTGASGPITELPGYKEGWFSVQDEASQMIELLTSDEPENNYLDACAGLGGKSMYLGNRVKVTALDPNGDRLGKILPEIKRLGRPVPFIVQGSLFKSPLKNQNFSQILVDAPCSNLGVIRRRPDVKWLKTEADIKKLAALQLDLLTAADRLLKPGGRLIYSVCTTTEEETNGTIKSFLKKKPSYELIPMDRILPDGARELAAKNGTLTSWPHKHDMDGFFAAVFEKK